MKTSIALRALVTLPGVPPAWPNQRLHHMELHRQKDVWKRLTWTLAQSARNRAGWPPLDRVEPAPRWVSFTLHRHRLLDQDNAVASIKPLLDGLKGVLIVDDSARWCHLFSVAQLQVPAGEVEHTHIVVYLAEPKAGT